MIISEKSHSYTNMQKKTQNENQEEENMFCMHP